VARLVSERLEGYAFAVHHVQASNGSPDAIVDEIHLVDDPQRPAHAVVVPLTAAGKRNLIAQLTGGLVVGTTH
jgi:hypothetical protein